MAAPYPPLGFVGSNSISESWSLKGVRITTGATTVNVRVGSKPVLTAPKRHFRSTANNEHRQTGPAVCDALAGTVERWCPSAIGPKVLWSDNGTAGTARPHLLRIFGARKIRGCSAGGVRRTQCPLCADGDQGHISGWPDMKEAAN